MKSARRKVWEDNCAVLKDPKLLLKYKIQETIIGEGSFGTVIKAKCRATQENRAIKAIRKIDKVQMLEIELELLTELGGHFNIVKFYDFYYIRNSVALVLEYFPHVAAAELLFYSKRDINFALVYFRNLLIAVSYLHQNGYIHRDIKLSNFLYSPQTNSFRLVDFGLATNDRSNVECPRTAAVAAMEKERECDTCKKTASPCLYCKGRPKRETYQIVGTPGVRAPELLFGVGQCSPTIDIFSCGIVLLSLVSAKHPFFMPKDESENIMNLAFLVGSKAIERMGQLEGMRVTISQFMPPADYYQLIMSLRNGFEYTHKNSPKSPCGSCRLRSHNNQNAVCFCRQNYNLEKFSTQNEKDPVMMTYVDLLYFALEPDRAKRYNADELLRVIELHEARAAWNPNSTVKK